MFSSAFREVGGLALPEYSGTRVMMMPVVIGDIHSVPDELEHWKRAIAGLFGLSDHHGEVGYLTIDEKTVQPAATHRRAGLHVDGVYARGVGSWGGGWGSVGKGMLTVASHPGCRAWNQEFDGWPGDEGQCDHLADQCDSARETLFSAGRVFWVDGLCVHESVPMVRPTARQFVRLSMPSTAPWFDGYTTNDKGVLPTGPILPRRSFLDM